MSEQVPLGRAAPDRPRSQIQSRLPVFGEGVAFASFPVLGLQICTLHETTREKYSGKEQHPFPEPLTGKKSLPDLERGGRCGPGTAPPPPASGHPPLAGTSSAASHASPCPWSAQPTLSPCGRQWLFTTETRVCPWNWPSVSGSNPSNYLGLLLCFFFFF